MKKAHHYKLHLQSVDESQEAAPEVLELQFGNHDDLFDVIRRVQEKGLFANNEQAAEFALGLKLFSEVMLKNRGLPIFEEFSPAFQTFMKRLKSA